MQDLGISVQSSEYSQLLLDEEKNRFNKAITVKTGEGVLPKGQIVAPDSTGYYVALKALAEVTDEVVALGQNGTRTNLSGVTANKPILPGSFSSEIGELTFTDAVNKRGMLTGSDGFGVIEYETGKIGLSLKTAALTTNTCTVSYYHFGNAGAVNLENLAILPEAVDATSEAVPVSNAIESGIVNYEALTPTISLSNGLTIDMLKKSGFGFKLKKEI